VLICGNVALMMFARAATRTSEIAVRSALGASRSRIVGQLFAEALVLGGIAALVGLVGAGFGMKWYVAMIEADTGGQFPFWIRDQLAPATVLYLCGLTLIGAAVAGVGPALKVTGRRVEPRLRQLAAGSGGLRLSGVWAAVIVAQVAVTVAFPATAFFFQRYVTSMQSLDLGFAAEEYLSVRLEMDGATASGRGPDELQATPEARLAAAAGELEERLANAPDVTGVTFANRLPGDAHPAARLQIEDAGSADQEGLPLHRAATARVDMNFFRVLGAPMHAGRDFDSRDAASDAGVVIVNQAFVDEVLAGRNPVGRRVRYAAQDDESPGRWLEIVGAADDLGMIGGDGEVRNEPGLYHPLAAGEGYPLQMAVHVRTDPDRFAPRLRALAAAVDPNLRLHDVRRLDRVSESRWRESEFLYQLLAGVSVVALILSLTTIYSVMAFTVSRRTREIGVRVALGSNPRRIVLSILLRPLTHVAVGILVGAILVSLVTLGLTGPPSVSELGLVAFYSAVMLGVCLLACIVPTHRALAVEPTEALRADG
jgi:putative ABC transport system permease protein